MLIPAWCVTGFIYLLDLLWVRYKCTKFHHFKIYGTDFKKGSPHPRAAYNEHP